jgi:hypothetical protein
MLPLPSPILIRLTLHRWRIRVLDLGQMRRAPPATDEPSRLEPSSVSRKSEQRVLLKSHGAMWTRANPNGLPQSSANGSCSNRKSIRRGGSKCGARCWRILEMALPNSKFFNPPPPAPEPEPQSAIIYVSDDEWGTPHFVAISTRAYGQSRLCLAGELPRCLSRGKNGARFLIERRGRAQHNSGAVARPY